MVIIIDGRAVSYTVIGKGPAVVCLHGWGDTKQSFAGLAQSLSKHYSVYRLDLPGFGESEAPSEAFDLENYAHVVHAFVQKVGIHKPHAYIGHSNGGAILIRGLSAGVLQSDCLVLVASSGVRSDYKGRKKAVRFAAKAAKIPTRLLPQNTQKILRKKAYAALGSDLFVAENLQETFKKVVSEDLVADAAMITVPTLLVYGKNDTATPISFGQRFADQIERSSLVVLDHAGHFVHQDKAEEVNQLIAEFLSKQ